jgi:hypothetical protein
VVSFIFELRLDTLITLLGIAAFGGTHGQPVRTFGMCVRHGKLPFQLLGTTSGARWLSRATYQRLELVVAAFADEIENRHDRMGGIA